MPLGFRKGPAMPLVTKRIRTIGTSAALVALCAGALAAASPGQAPPRSSIPHSHPSWASAAKRSSTAPVTAGTVVSRVYLAGQDPPGLAAYAQAVSTPGSASYGQYVTPATGARQSGGRTRRRIS